jgi:hypothetical protein
MQPKIVMEEPKKNETKESKKEESKENEKNEETDIWKKAKFGPAYDCIGILSPGIVSGIFVTFLIGTVLAIAICKILDIKPPNKFESRSAKQLTFTVQE